MLYYMQNCQRNYFGAHNAPTTRGAFHECGERNCAAQLHDYCTFALAHAKVNRYVAPHRMPAAAAPDRCQSQGGADPLALAESLCAPIGFDRMAQRGVGHGTHPARCYFGHTGGTPSTHRGTHLPPGTVLVRAHRAVMRPGGCLLRPRLASDWWYRCCCAGGIVMPSDCF